jgi:uncharacterized protein (TIGR03437 family)
MKLYTYVLAFAVGSPQVWGADAARVTYHVETMAGSSRIGDGGPALSAQFSNIQGIAVDRLGNLYLSDTSNHRVRKVSGGIVTTIAGTGVAGYSGDGGSALNAQLNFPYGLALDSAGNLYLADFGNEVVRKIAPDGTITTIAGTGQKASSPDGAPPLGTSLLSPRNVAVDGAGNLYIAEFDGHRVRKLGTDGKILTVAGTGEAGWNGDDLPATAAQLHYPAGMAFDRAGALYIADSGNHVVRKIFADGMIGTVLGAPPGKVNQTLLGTPVALAVDAAGTLYIADKWGVLQILKLTTAGVTSMVAEGAALSELNDIAADANGNLWIASGVLVRKVDSTGTIQTVAGDGYLHAVGDGGPAAAANLYQPSALTLDGAGNLFIADMGINRVRQVAPDGTIATLAGTGAPGLTTPMGGAAANAALDSPASVTMDASGDVVIADASNNRIVAVNVAHRLLAVAGTGAPGETDGVPPLLAALNGPRAVCTDRGGNLYIADTGNDRVLKLSPGGVLQTVAGNGSWGYAGDGGDARLAQLSAPGACAIDSAGTLYIADTGNYAIRKVAAGKISTVAGTGIAGSAVDEGTAASAQLASPHGVAVDDAGDIFIADTGNNQIRMVTPDGLIHVIAGTGFAGFAGDGGPATAAQLNGPQGLFLDGAGDLYFADTNNNRIRRLVPDAPAPAPVVMPVSTVTVVNALSLLAGSVAPGEVVSIFGLGLGPDLGVTGTLDASGMLPGILAGVEVQFNGSDAPIFYAVSGQINAQVPYVVAGSDASTVAVIYQGKVVGTATVGMAPSAPGLLTVATNQDGTVNAQAAPAARGGWMTFCATGEGLTDSGDVAGTPAQAPYPHPLLAISLTIAGLDAEILYAGSAPDLIGVMQINARVPGGFVPPGEAAVVLTVGTATAPAVTVWLK